MTDTSIDTRLNRLRQKLVEERGRAIAHDISPPRTKPRKSPYTVIEVDLVSGTASVVGNINRKHDDYRNEWPGGPRCFRLVYSYGKFIAGRASGLERNEAWERAKQIAAAAIA
jgi:hypothetical protein